MKKNMSNLDRIIRVLIAVVVSYLYYAEIISGTLGIVLIALAAIFLLTSFISFCPIYAMLRTGTRKS